MKRALHVHSFVLLAGLVAIGYTPALGRGQEPAPGSGGPAPTTRDDVSTKGEGTSTTAKAKEPEHIYKTPEQWRGLLTPEQFMVTRLKVTENPFSGKYAIGHFKGTFLCVCCGAKLFDSRTKFDSGTGWPSFWRPVSVKAVDNAWDYSDPAEARVEVTCHRCGAHLGHVFQDGPPPTGLRYCINSLSLRLDSEKPGKTTSTRRANRHTTSKTSRKGRATSGHTVGKSQSKPAQTDQPKS
ncbi:MAG: peptide-methionine (R)-S-oxide reductase MsrB [Isosphaeraceae bacterium]